MSSTEPSRPATWPSGWASAPDLAAQSGLDPVAPLSPQAPDTRHAAAPATSAVGPLDDPARWEPRGELAAGGMGIVTVVHDRWLGRDIAVKIPNRDEDAQRLLREARVTAGLDHPGIVAVFDAGHSPSGVPWFAMRLVRGRSLAEVLGKARIEPAPETSLDTLLRHVLAAAEAVGFANAHGVIHRDLKPANIMIGPFGETQVIDWGLALSTQLQSPDPGRAGTARSMSPEQARGGPLDARTDVYALGAILREVATGQALFPASIGRDTIIDTLARGDLPALPGDSAIPPELAAVIACAMHPDPARRYADAKAFADELARYLAGLRVSAHTYSPAEMLSRLFRAWRLPILLGLASLTIVIGTLVLAVAEVSSERDLTEHTLGRALVSGARSALRQDDRGQAEILALAALDRGDFPEARGVLAALPTDRPRREWSDLPGCEVSDVVDTVDHRRVLCRGAATLSVRDGPQLLWEEPLTVQAAFFIAEGEAIVVQVDGKRVERLDARTGASLGDVTEPCQYGRLGRVADRRTAFLHNNGCAMVLSLDTEQPIPLDGCHEPMIRTMAIDADGRRWAVVCADGGVVTGRLDDAHSARFETAFAVAPQRPLPSALAIIDDRTLLLGESDGAVQLVDLEHPTQRKRLILNEGLVRDVHLDPEKHHALILYESGAPFVIDYRRWGSLGRLPPRSSGYRAVAFEGDGRVRVGVGGRIETWDFADVPVRELNFDEGVSDLALSPDGATLAVAHGAALTLLERTKRRHQRELKWQSELVRTVVFDPATPHSVTPELYAASFGERGARRLSANGNLGFLPLQPLIRRAVAWPDGHLLVNDFMRRLWVLRPDAEPAAGPDLLAQMHISSSDHRHLVVLDTKGQLWLGLDWAPGGGLRPLANRPSALAIAGMDSGRIFTVERHAIIELDTDGQAHVTYDSADSELVTGAIAPRAVAAGGRDGSVWLWRRGEGRAFAILRDHDRRVDRVAFEPAGLELVAGDWDGRLLFIDAAPSRSQTPTSADAAQAWGLELDAIIPR